MDAPTFPMRPISGGFLTQEKVDEKYVYRPKVDGDRVLVETTTRTAFNRQGQPYTKAHKLPWEGLAAFAYRQERSSTTPRPLLPASCQWLDIEFLCKHEERNGYAVILDFPYRTNTFGESQDDLAENLMPEMRSGTSMLTSGCEGVMLLPFFTQWAGGRNVMARWEFLRDKAKDIMKLTAETTPFYEGVVAVKRDSAYTRQIASPTKKTGDWVKYRFSN